MPGAISEGLWENTATQILDCRFRNILTPIESMWDILFAPSDFTSTLVKGTKRF